MKIVFVNLSPGAQKVGIVFDRLPALIGRGTRADIRLPDCWASRIHCEIIAIDGTLVVRDLESRNGTLVNGEQVTEALLLPDDRLTVGITRLQVKYQRARVEAPAAIQGDLVATR